MNLPKVNSSFITTPIKNAVNATKNVFKNTPKNTPKNESSAPKNENIQKNSSFTSFKNTARSVFNGMSEDVKVPIMESVNGSNNFPLSVPIIIGVGILIVAFIIVVIFRTQIAIALEVTWDNLKGMFTPAPTPTVEPPPPEFSPEPVEKLLPSRKEVFNIAQDKYTYTDAEPLCKAFGAELATYDQVKEAWEKGADWCNYGWVKGQTAVYPTQDATYNKLQAGPEDQRDACGVPGVNGGFFDNPELRFGVNCYGKKPSENETDARKIMSQNANLSPGALEYDKKVRDYKTQMGQIPVNPFKPDAWSS